MPCVTVCEQARLFGKCSIAKDLLTVDGTYGRLLCVWKRCSRTVLWAFIVGLEALFKDGLPIFCQENTNATIRFE
jgi:hypothetical protein